MTYSASRRKTSNCHGLTVAQFGFADANPGAGRTTQIELERQRRDYRVCQERSRGSDAAYITAPLPGVINYRISNCSLDADGI